MSAQEPEFLGIFRDEANERLDSIVEVLLALEHGAGGPDAVERLFRDTHTIKGSAAMLGLDDVRNLAHAVEDVLADVRDGGVFPVALADPLMRAADALRAQVNDDGPADPELVAELAAFAEGAPDEVDQTSPTTHESTAPVAADKRTVRVPAEKLDRLLDLVGETVLHRRRLQHDLAGVGSQSGQLADELDLGDRLLGELQDAAIRARTLPLGSITGPLPRAVRDAAVAAGKDVELIVAGAETELDRVILEGLSEPLVHMLRNAVAHGIESPSERERAGKPARGRVELAAEQRGRLVAVTVADDGRGVGRDLLERAQSAGSLVELLTQPGFSTSERVDNLAGRGVGLDAVRAYAQMVGGDLEIESEPGEGMRITLLLPLTLALLEVLLVERGANVFGLPLPSVQEAVSVTQVLSLTGREALELRGESVHLVDLADLVGTAAPSLAPNSPALVVAATGRRIAAVCDRVLGEEEVVVKSLGSLLASTSGYLGAAILGDGRIALLLDPTALVRKAPRALVTHEASATDTGTATKLLVVEDSFAVRELQRSILEAAGYRVETAKNGKDALDRLTRDDDISLVVTDIDMPEMDGLALTQAIRARPDRSSLPVVVVTSHAGPDDRQRGIDAGADAYMVKREFDQNALLETVGRLVGR